ncbi:unnamed protein product [Mycena citricolor]|uniref:Secreted protein n=1 Tax=Mycena citricolor TaxID=2018698 RepID=A0AAD2HYG6_9AGAR|nr:unnamed protein product [Mycena citricolor]
MLLQSISIHISHVVAVLCPWRADQGRIGKSVKTTGWCQSPDRICYAVSAIGDEGDCMYYQDRVGCGKLHGSLSLIR